MTRSCHDNKSQRVDPFIVLSRIIAGKHRYVKDPFSASIHAEASHDAGCGQFYGFWENWGNARTNRIGTKMGGRREGEDALREF
ncbi:hypothetical protein BSY51_19920 [Salmonella enterica]|nr:hypothetical protein [Salmonella enterica]